MGESFFDTGDLKISSKNGKQSRTKMSGMGVEDLFKNLASYLNSMSKGFFFLGYVDYLNFIIMPIFFIVASLVLISDKFLIHPDNQKCIMPVEWTKVSSDYATTACRIMNMHSEGPEGLSTNSRILGYKLGPMVVGVFYYLMAKYVCSPVTIRQQRFLEMLKKQGMKFTENGGHNVAYQMDFDLQVKAKQDRIKYLEGMESNEKEVEKLKEEIKILDSIKGSFKEKWNEAHPSRNQCDNLLNDVECSIKNTNEVVAKFLHESMPKLERIKTSVRISRFFFCITNFLLGLLMYSMRLDSYEKLLPTKLSDFEFVPSKVSCAMSINLMSPGQGMNEQSRSFECYFPNAQSANVIISYCMFSLFLLGMAQMMAWFALCNQNCESYDHNGKHRSWKGFFLQINFPEYVVDNFFVWIEYSELMREMIKKEKVKIEEAETSP